MYGTFRDPLGDVGSRWTRIGIAQQKHDIFNRKSVSPLTQMPPPTPALFVARWSPHPPSPTCRPPVGPNWSSRQPAGPTSIVSHWPDSSVLPAHRGVRLPRTPRVHGFGVKATGANLVI